MARTEMKDLSLTELTKGFRLCHQNAKTLFAASQKLAEDSFIPIANSILILAVEEEIKGQLLHGFRLNPELQNKIDFGKLFSSHHHRKESARIAFWYYQNLSRFIHAKGFEKVLSNPEFHLAWFDQDESKSIGGPSKNDHQIDDWFSQMISKRETGFYVDYRNGNWSLPDLITSEHLSNSVKICEVLIGIGDHLEEGLSQN